MPLPVGDWQQSTPNVLGSVLVTAAAATIAPTGFFTKLTGNAAAVATITPLLSGPHIIAIQFAGIAGVTTGGNILSVKATVADQILLLYYDVNASGGAKYVPIG